MCKRIGIISGGGNLPILIGKSLLNKNYEIIFFCIKNYTDLRIYKDFDYTEVSIDSFTSILNTLKDKKIEEIIMIGNIVRPSIKDIKFDINTISLIKDYLLESKGDDQLLRSISNFFIKKGYPLFDWKNVCDDLFVSSDYLTNIKPSKNALKNLNKGLNIFKSIGNADIGQSMIIQNQLILGIECIEGTDELIKRCKKYKRKEDKGILLKLSKYKQHNDLDLPAIGIKTLENIKKYSYEGIFIEKKKCIIIDKEIVVSFCNQNNLFLSTVNKID